MLLPLLILIGTGLWGLDFGLHWDERPWQIGPVKTMVKSATLLPGYYDYPSFDYWLNLLVLAPDVATPRVVGESLREHLIHTLDSHGYLMRLRIVYLVITSLTIVWVYLLVLEHRGSWPEALFAASVLACSWEVAYHARWVATDGILMQFAALTVLLAAHALKNQRRSWLFAAAAVAGLGCATKYPGGLLILPVGLAGVLRPAGYALWEKVDRLVKVAVVFVLIYLAVTPASILQPRKVAHAVLFEMSHYAIGGHGSHIVGRGFEHAWRMLIYFSSICLSPYPPVALLIFVLAIVGIVSLTRRSPGDAAVLFVFPFLYLLYFSMQRAMVVRNLLAVIPFLAIAAARGAVVIGESLGTKEDTAGLQWPRANWRSAAWTGLLVAALCVNAWWLIASAESIVARHSDRFVREAAAYIREHTNRKFLLSPRVTRDVAMVAPPLENITGNPAEADVFVLYAREGMRRWHDWTANRRDLAQACFGPREVNFDMYPEWWGDDRILLISRRSADAVGLYIAGVSNDTPLPVGNAEPRSPATKMAWVHPIVADSLPGSWDSNGVETYSSPPIDPRLLVPKDQAESIVGGVVRGPTTGGWELDGRGCSFFGPDDLVVRLTIISTNAFGLERNAPGSAGVSNVGLSAYVTAGGPLGDVRLLARTVNSAVAVYVSGGPGARQMRLDMARQFAVKALDNLDAIAASRHRD